MKERPILFSAPMVLALLSGQKTQTRRVVKMHASSIACCCGGSAARWVADGDRWHCGTCGGGARLTPKDVEYIRCPYGMPGDQLWVRESLKAVYDERELIIDYAYAADGVKVPRDPTLDQPFNDGFAFAHLARPGGVPSIHMPRWASRITLNVTGVRVERLQAISRGDAMSEGCPFPNMADGDDPRNWFADLWAQINGAESWEANPWVWAIDFKRTTE